MRRHCGSSRRWRGDLGHTARKDQLASQLQRIQAQRLSLEPWAELDVRLELHRSGQLSVIPAPCPCGRTSSRQKTLWRNSRRSWYRYPCRRSSSIFCCWYIRRRRAQCWRCCGPFGFAAASFGTLTGTVQENLQRLDDEEEQTRQDRRAEDAALDALGGRQPELKLGLDRLKLQIQREDNRQRLLTDGHIFYLEGWVPEAGHRPAGAAAGGLLLCVGPAGPHRGGVSGGAGDAEEQLAHPVHDLHHGAVLHARL